MINTNWLSFPLKIARKQEAERQQKITEATELVIEAAIDHGYIEDSRSEGDYDLNVSKEGAEKIRKILEAL